MNRLSTFAIACALLAACVALVWLLAAERPAPEPVSDYRVAQEAPVALPEGLGTTPAQGGVYAGRVVDVEDRPIPGAHVMLVEYNAGDADLLRVTGSDVEEGYVPEVGDFRFGGETRTDEDGRFRIAADAQSRIQHVLAWSTGHFLAVQKVAGPTEDVLLRLERGGRVIGTVVDDASGRPVKGAEVDVYLQQKVGHMPDLPADARYPLVQREAQHKVEWLATLGRFLPEVLGPRVWEIPAGSREALRLVTDGNGHFEIGPLGNSVQLEFVITHPKYKWHDFDTDGGKHYAQRTVVEPGETVRREFRLLEGEFVAGQVVDDTGKGLEQVVVEVQSITAYYRHAFYRHMWRRALTDREGRFRVEGLARGSQQVILKHASFGTKVETAEAGTSNLVIVADRLGALEGRVEGTPTGRLGRKITVVLEATGETAPAGRHQRESTRMDAHNAFALQRVQPGTYRVWLHAGSESSQPVELEILPHAVTQAVFELGGGGTLGLRVFDADGRLLDPASGRLVAMRGGREQALGSFVSREGEISAEGVAPGIYKLEVSAPGRIPSTTEAFEIQRGRTTLLSPVVLRSWGYLRVGQPVDGSGRPARLEADTLIEIRQGEEPFRRVFLTTGADVAVRPGPLEVRARSGDMRFERQVEIQDGATFELTIVFERAR